MNSQYVLAVTPEEGQLLLEALGEVPAKISMGLINKIEQQTSNQQEIRAKIYAVECAKLKGEENAE